LVPCHTESAMQINALLNDNTSIWHDLNDPLLDWSLNPRLSQGLEIQPTAAPLLQKLEGEAKLLRTHLNYPTGPQPAAPSHHAESSNSSLARNEKKRYVLR